MRDKKCLIDDCQSCHEECNVCDIIQSIALQEAGLAHILNAEGEKIQKAVAENYSAKELLCINDSVAQVIAEVTKLEIILSDKLKNALSYQPKEEPCGCSGKVRIIAVCDNSSQPICGVKISIYDNKYNLLIEDCTDSHGQYSICLDCGEYRVVVCYNGVEIVKNIVIDCDHKHIYITEKFPCPPTPPPPPICQLLSVSGRVYDNYGRTLCGAKIYIDGTSCPIATSNECGYYEIKLRACECVRLYAECDGRRSASTLIYLSGEKALTTNLTVNMSR